MNAAAGPPPESTLPKRAGSWRWWKAFIADAQASSKAPLLESGGAAFSRDGRRELKKPWR